MFKSIVIRTIHEGLSFHVPNFIDIKMSVKERKGMKCKANERYMGGGRRLMNGRIKGKWLGMGVGEMSRVMGVW